MSQFDFSTYPSQNDTNKVSNSDTELDSWWNNIYRNLTRVQESNPVSTGTSDYNPYNSMGLIDIGPQSGGTTPIPQTTSWWDTAMDNASAIAPLAQAGLGFYLGNKQLGLAKDQLATQKQQFSDQFNVQVDQVNRDRYDQAYSRYMGSPTAFQNPGQYEDYIKTNGITA